MRPSDLHITAREVLELVEQLDNDSALIASLRAEGNGEAVPDDQKSPVLQRLARAREWRGWTPWGNAILDIRDGLAGKASRRPYDQGADPTRRKVVEEIPF